MSARPEDIARIEAWLSRPDPYGSWDVDPLPPVAESADLRVTR